MMHFAEDQYGFEWGPVKVERLCHDDKTGWAILSVNTPKYHGSGMMQIYVTKTGKVRVYDSRGEWTPPGKGKA